MGTQCDSATLPDAVSPYFKGSMFRATGHTMSREGGATKDEVRRPAIAIKWRVPTGLWASTET